ncbi:hypothetical protein LguiB_019056 [Lonicera macranthoides]
MKNATNSGTGDPFLVNYNAPELRIASEFLSTWLPFLTRDLCNHCTQTLTDRVRSIDHEVDGGAEPSKQGENITVSIPNNTDSIDCNNKECDTNSLGSWKDGGDINDSADTNSLGSWKDGSNGWLEPNAEASTSNTVGLSTPVESRKVRMSWADMAQEDELEADEENAISNVESGEATEVVKITPKTELSREQREYIRFSNVKRKKDYICLERVNGKIVNILDGLELHTGVFSAAEQKRIVDYVYLLEEMGKNGELKERTYTAPHKWMKGKGRVTIQFGCCYNYAIDKNGNPPGILQNELVDPIPHLFKVIIRRLVRWHVLPPTCVPDSCIVNIYDEGDCIPPHIDNHDFVRPFCTVSFLSECNILFGLNLKVRAAGEFDGSFAIPLPVGSVLVLNGNGADVAKHCVPAVPTKRISLTFRKMDESKWPIGFVPEPDLQGLEPLTYEPDGYKRSNQSKSKRPMNRQSARREDNNIDRTRGFSERGFDPHFSGRSRPGPPNRRRVRVNVEY